MTAGGGEGSLRGQLFLIGGNGSTLLPKVRIQEFLEEDPAFIRLIYQYLGWAAFWLLLGTTAGLAVHLILDNYGTHKTPRIHRWLVRHPRFHVQFTPTGASWINLVERWFAGLTEKQLRRGVHRSTRELEAAIRQYIDATNGQPKPFVWTKTADEILASVARFCTRISDSGH